MGATLEIGGELSADGVRRAARREKDGRAAARMCAIAHALDGLSRAEAARLAGMERQALRDAVLSRRWWKSGRRDLRRDEGYGFTRRDQSLDWRGAQRGSPTRRPCAS